MSRQLTIVKAHLDKEDKLSVEYTEQTKDGLRSVAEDGPAPIHPDLKRAFTGLNTHLASLCEQYGPDEQLSDNVECRTFTQKIDDKNAGVTLSGVRKVSGNKSFAINAPFLHWNRASDYDRMPELADAIGLCEEEVKAYIVDGKHGTDPQMDMFDAKPEHTLTEEQKIWLSTTEKNAAAMVAIAGIEPDMAVLVPGAGLGVLVKQIGLTDSEMKVDCYENNLLCKQLLKDVPQANIVGHDFLKTKVPVIYDRIIAAPPRDKNQEIEHITKMYACLKDGGRIVALVSDTTMNGKKAKRFSEWLKEVEAVIKPAETVQFDSEGNEQKVQIVIIDKPCQK